MEGWWRAIAVAALVTCAFYLTLIVLARRLPPGPLRDLLRVLPDCVVALRALHRDPRVPRSAKAGLWIALIWVLSPIDLIPEFLPVIGPLDDIVVVALALRHAVKVSPREAIEDAWPGDPAMLERLLPVGGGSLFRRGS
ncbi:YkvA family protein [Nocardioides mesophilus]|uniref:DUF1232 domain-containing protein n=1 Tax=Nocardioides mesophilus TaxID=433659 RepID=A0A7G9REU9_9ACTN|nr:DUF1232 domain-containing protein [Nocardioides mesophilus]QNN54124.1 DUF1232 domain-containing protein [Nocardioides mesophilus]